MRIIWRLLIALVVLLALLLGADRASHWALERGITDAIQSAPGVVGGDEDLGVHVDVEGLPVLTQLVSSRLDSLIVRIPSYLVDTGAQGVHISDIDAHLVGVSTQEPHIATTVSATGTIGNAELASFVHSTGVPGEVSFEEGGARISAAFMGQPLSMFAELSVAPSGRALLITPSSVQWGDAEASLDWLLTALGAQGQVQVSLESIPPGITISSIEVTDTEVHVDLDGEMVNLSGFQP